MDWKRWTRSAEVASGFLLAYRAVWWLPWTLKAESTVEKKGMPMVHVKPDT